MTFDTRPDDVRQLQACVRDLTSLMALPALWQGREPSQIVETLLDALVSMLRLEFAYTRLHDTSGGTRDEAVRLRQPDAACSAQDIGRALDRWLTPDAADEPLVIPNPVGEGEVSLARMWLGLAGELGVVAAGSRRVDFPTATESLLLQVAANQLAVALQGSRLLTEHQRAEAALRESEERLARVVETIAEGVVTIGPDGRFASVNAAGERILGVERDQFIGLDSGDPPYRRLTLDGEPRVDTPSIAELAANSDTVFEHEYVIERADGTRVTIARSIAAVCAGDGTFLGAVSTFSDITARRSIEETRERLLAVEQETRREAEAANRAKDEFLSMLSHELRTPLTPIIGFTEMLRRGPSSPERTALALDAIERSARIQARLVSDLLDVSRILADKLPLEFALTDIAAVVEAAVAAVRPEIEANSLTLAVDLDRFALVQGDADRLQQVVWNLLSNAAKFTPEGGAVGVRLDQDGDRVRVVVTDTGEGIAPEHLPHIFDRFRQGDVSTTRRHGGLGLGLAIAQHLVERHDGTLTAENNAGGVGACFTVRLPRATAARLDTPPVPGEGETAAPLAGLHLLVVEDDADTQTLMRLLLEGAGAAVTAVASSVEGIAALDRDRVDAIVADIGLPDEDGYGFIRRVRTRSAEDGGRVPALALTAFASRDDRNRALAAGFQQHLAKPVDRDVLLDVLIRLTARREENHSHD